MHADPSIREREPAPEDDGIFRSAAAWVARRDRGLTPAEERAFAQWRAADPRHAAEFSRLASSWREFDIAKADPELVAMAGALDERTRHRVRHSHWALPWAGVVAAAAAMVAVAWIGGWRSPHQGSVASKMTASQPAARTYDVVPSVARRMALPDGSSVELRGESVVKVEFTAEERRVRLVRGEAHFKVAKDAARPFSVSAGRIAVRAVGTVFNIRLDSARVEVLVTEGKVRVDGVATMQSVQAATSSSAAEPLPPAAVAPGLLVAGQRAVIAVESTTGRPFPADLASLDPAQIDEELSWQRTVLVFHRTPLTDAMEAFNRHGAHRLVLGDSSLQTRLLGGSFRADNVESFVRLLELTADVRAERRGDRMTVLWPSR